jgi:hypothetical protein
VIPFASFPAPQLELLLERRKILTRKLLKSENYSLGARLRSVVQQLVIEGRRLEKWPAEGVSPKHPLDNGVQKQSSGQILEQAAELSVLVELG